MKRKTALFISVPIALVAIGYWATREEGGDFAVLESGGRWMKAVPVDRFRTNPAIDLTVFGYAIQFPKKHHLPVGQTDKATAGALLFNLQKGGDPFAYEWTVGEHRWPLGLPAYFSGTSFIMLPKAFGSKPRELDFASKSNKARISLPPLGRPAPVIAEKTFRVGGAVIRVKPIEWISPAFPILCDVTLERESLSDTYLFDHGGDRGFILQKGQVSHVCLYRIPDRRGVWLSGELTPVRVSRVEVRVSATTTLTGGRQVTVNWPDGSLLTGYTEDPNGWAHSGPFLKGQAALHVAGLSIGSLFYFDYPPRDRETDRNEIMDRLTAIAKQPYVQATEFRPISPGQAVRLDLGEFPTPQDFGVRVQKR